MKFLLIAIGSRGDVEPFLAVGELLRKNGHEVICQFPEQFRELAEKSQLEFEGLSSDFLDMLYSDDGKMVMGGGGSFFKKIGAFYRVYKKSLGINQRMMEQQYELVNQLNPDRIIYSAKSTYPVIWEIQNPGKSIHLSPIPYLIHAVKDHAHIGFNGDFGEFLNGLTYKLINFALAKNIIDTSKEYQLEFGITPKQIKGSLLTKRMIYSISPVFFPNQDYWPSNVKVLGYHERNQTPNWHPSEELEQFIANHSKILFVTFGSMTNPEPEAKTRIILEVLKKNKIPAIINVAAGGLVVPEKYDSSLFHFVAQIPYEWVLPKMYAILHHGGSGTTHLAVKYGCASMIIPHIMDQHIWNDLNVKLGVGPKGVPVNKLSVPKLTPLIQQLWSNSKYSEVAVMKKDKINTDDSGLVLYQNLIL
jgi:UDP:flavonoid glycosyltransferase YjiC (YdhE family)